MVLLAPDLSREQSACVKKFDLGRWMPVFLSSSMEVRPSQTGGPLRKKNASILRKSG
jgi:hypothetical protein